MMGVVPYSLPHKRYADNYFTNRCNPKRASARRYNELIAMNTTQSCGLAYIHLIER
jgi:hypothetical protein